MTKSKINVGLVGLGFGAEFAAIYRCHPDVDRVVICDINSECLDRVGAKYDMLSDKDIDAIHVVTGIPLHAKQSIATLQAGKHCACTVPMATSIDDIRAIIEAKRQSNKTYMMMETVVYERAFLYVKDLMERGELGRIQLLRGAHYQDMENWPSYWAGLPPMWYATHAISPLMAISGSRAKSVHCFGSGVMREELHKQYDNPYPIETAIFEMASGNLAAEVTRALFYSARAYSESFNVYGEDATFEWQQLGSEEPVLFRLSPLGAKSGARSTEEERLHVPDRADLLPKEIASFTQKGVYNDENKHFSFTHGGGHGGSHPHMVHEFVRCIIEERKPEYDEIDAANWTAAGICAHESAMNNGKKVIVPSFD